MDFGQHQVSMRRRMMDITECDRFHQIRRYLSCDSLIPLCDII